MILTVVLCVVVLCVLVLCVVLVCGVPYAGVPSVSVYALLWDTNTLADFVGYYVKFFNIKT